MLLSKILEITFDFLFGRWITLYSSVSLNETEGVHNGPE